MHRQALDALNDLSDKVELYRTFAQNSSARSSRGSFHGPAVEEPQAEV